MVKKNFRLYELIIFNLTAVIYTTAGIMIVPFALLYTKGVNDVTYYRPVFALIATMAGAFSCFRVPYQTVTEAAGHYRQTRNGAIIEVIINIAISLLAVVRFGLIGVAIGTLVSFVFRSLQFAIYLSKNIIKRSIWIFFGHVFVNAIIVILSYLFADRFLAWEIQSFLQWTLKACCVTGFTGVITLLFSILFYKKDLLYLLDKIKNMKSHHK